MASARENKRKISTQMIQIGAQGPKDFFTRVLTAVIRIGVKNPNGLAPPNLIVRYMARVCNTNSKDKALRSKICRALLRGAEYGLVTMKGNEFKMTRRAGVSADSRGRLWMKLPSNLCPRVPKTMKSIKLRQGPALVPPKSIYRRSRTPQRRVPPKSPSESPEPGQDELHRVPFKTRQTSVANVVGNRRHLHRKSIATQSVTCRSVSTTTSQRQWKAFAAITHQRVRICKDCQAKARHEGRDGGGGDEDDGDERNDEDAEEDGGGGDEDQKENPRGEDDNVNEEEDAE